jgi:hypothetical protein
MKTKINDYNGEITIEMLDGMGDLRVTQGKIDDVLNAEKGSRVADEVLYYLNLDWLGDVKKYEQDHLHPESKFNLQDKPLSVTPEDWRKWRGDRNRLPNLHLLKWQSNVKKSDMPLAYYFENLSYEDQARFREEALLPENVSLEIDDFNEFYEERKKLLAVKIREMLT